MISWPVEPHRTSIANSVSRYSSLLMVMGNTVLQKNIIVAGYLVAVTVVYLLFLFFYNPWVFDNGIGYLDPFLYVGYGLYYSYPDFIDWYYKVSRLPWDLLEFVARHIFLPGAATFFLQAFSFSLMSVCVFFGFRRLISSSNALLLAVLSIFLPMLQASGGADYHNTIVGGLYFLTLALLSISIAEGSILFAGYAGAAAAASLHTNPVLILLAPAVALQCLTACRVHKRNLRFMSIATAASLVGVAGATIALGLIAAAFGRDFLFFKPQLDYIISLQGQNPMWQQFSWVWLRHSKSNAYLFVIFIICVVELVVLAARREIRNASQAASAFTGYASSYVLTVAYQFKGQTILQPDYMNYVLFVATFVPLGYLFERHLPPVTDRGLAILCALLPLASAAVLIGSGPIYQTLHLFFFGPFFLVVIALAGIYLVLIAFRATTLNLAIVLLPVLNIALIPSLAFFTPDLCRAVHHLNLYMNQASLLATSLRSQPKRVYVFADPREQMTEPCFKGIKTSSLAASFTEIGHEFLGKPFGEQQLDQLTRDDFAGAVGDDGIVALLAVQQTTLDHFLATTKRLGIDLQLAALLPDPASGATLHLFRPSMLSTSGFRYRTRGSSVTAPLTAFAAKTRGRHLLLAIAVGLCCAGGLVLTAGIVKMAAPSY